MSISEEKKKTISVTSLALSANLAGKIISIPTGIVIASILGPEDYGLLAIVTLIIQYLSYLNLGFLTNITREVPIAYGRGDLDEVKTVYSTVFTNFTLTTIFGIIILGFAYLLGYDFGGEIQPIHFLLIVLIKIAAYLDSYFRTYVKGEGKFIIFGQYELVNRIILPILTLVLVYFFHLEGMLISIVLSHVIGTVFSWVRLGKPFVQFKINYTKTLELMRTGNLMFLNKVIDGIFISIGLIMAGVFLQKVDVGLLSFALVIASVKKVPSIGIFNIIIGRKMGIEYGKLGMDNHSAFSKFFSSPLILYSMLLTTLMGLLVILYSFSVKIFLHKFTLSLPIFIILYFAVNFYNIRHIVYQYFNITRQMNRRSIILIVGVFVNGLFSYISIQMGYGIIGIAVSISIAFLVISVNSIFITFNQVFPRSAKKYIFLVKLTLISGFLTGILYLFTDFMFFEYIPDPKIFGEMVIAALDFGLKLVIFSILSVSSYILLFWSDKIHNELWNIIVYMMETIYIKLKREKYVAEA